MFRFSNRVSQCSLWYFCVWKMHKVNKTEEARSAIHSYIQYIHQLRVCSVHSSIFLPHSQTPSDCLLKPGLFLQPAGGDRERNMDREIKVSCFKITKEYIHSDFSVFNKLQVPLRNVHSDFSLCFKVQFELSEHLS